MIFTIFMCAFISCNRDDNSVCQPQQSDIPIQFAALTEWPILSKAIITEKNKTEYAFSVWANRTYDDVSETVFDCDEVKYYDNNWGYKGTKYWQLGDYSFAAVMPYYSGSFDDDKITLDFSGGFSLKDTQTDLMVAFHEKSFEDIDEITPETSTVALNFSHIFSLLNIKISTDAPEKSFKVRSITVYGIHESLNGELVLGSDINGNIYNNISALMPDELTVKGSPYIFDNNSGEGWIITGVDAVITNLLVFPEVFSDETPLYIKIEYGEDDSKELKITSGEWLSNHSYTYIIDADEVKIGDPKVEPWVIGGKNENIIK